MIETTKHIAALLLFAVAFFGCVEPYDYQFEEKSNQLVVEAAISTLQGPQTVRLSTTRNIFNRDNEYVLYVEDAIVSVEGSDGNISNFAERNSGHYVSAPDFQAIEGMRYKLRIAVLNGEVYESAWQEVIATSDMGGIEVDYSKKVEENEQGNFVEVDGFNVKAIVNDNVEQRNFYLMRMKLTYKLLTFPELYEIFNPTLGEYVSAPKSCCNICWVGQTLGDFVVYSDQQVNGSANAEIPLIFYPIESKHFYDKVYFEVFQYSLSAEAYAFWRAMYDLKFRQGTLFDPAPSRLPGNIFNVNDPEEQVVGYFTVSGVSSTGDFITKDMIERNVRYSYEFNDDCRELANSTTEQPGFWR